MLPAYRNTDGSSPDQAEDLASESGPQLLAVDREEEITEVGLVSARVLSALMEMRLHAAQTAQQYERPTEPPPAPTTGEVATIPPPSGLRETSARKEAPTLPPPGSGIAETKPSQVVRELLPTEEVVEDWFEALTDAPAAPGRREPRKTMKMPERDSRRNTLVMPNRPVPPAPAARSIRRQPIPFIPGTIPLGRKTSWLVRLVVLVLVASTLIGGAYAALRWSHGTLRLPRWSAT